MSIDRRHHPEGKFPSADRAGTLLVWGVLLVVSAGLAAFGTVHPGWSFLVGGLAGAVGLWAIATLPLPGRRALVIAFMVPLVVTALLWIPLGGDLRGMLQPGIGGLVEESLSMVGRSRHSLALRPAQHLSGLAFAVQCVLLAVGTAAICVRMERVKTLAPGLLMVGTSLVILHGLQRFLHAPSIYWISGVGSSGPFGSFVSPNHAAIFLAALVPVGLGCFLGGPPRWRPFLLAWFFLTAGGVFLTHSRSAPLLCMAAIVITLLVGLRWRVTRFLWLGILGTVGVVAAVGWRPLMTRYTEWLEPSSLYWDVFAHRGQIFADSMGLLSPGWVGGVGLGGFEDAYKTVKSVVHHVNVYHAHNEYIQGLVELGSVGFILWLVAGALALGLPFLGLRGEPVGPNRWFVAGFSGSALTILLSGVYDFPFRIGALGLLLAVALGASWGMRFRGSGLVDRKLAAGLLVFSGLWMLVNALNLPEPACPSGDQGCVEDRLSQQPLRSDLLLSRTQRAALAGEWEEARQRGALVSRIDPSLPASNLLNARMARQVGDVQAAQGFYLQLLRYEVPGHPSPDAYIEEALEVFDSGRAMADRLTPHRPDRGCQIARILERKGRPDESEPLFREAVVAEPLCAIPWGDALNRRGEYQRAIKLVGSMPPLCGTALVQGGATYGLGQPEEALQWYEQARRMCGSDHQPAWYGYARALAATGDPRGVEPLRALVEGQPNVPGYRRALAQAHLDVGNFADALVLWEALLLSPKSTAEDVDGYLMTRRRLSGETP